MPTHKKGGSTKQFVPKMGSHRMGENKMGGKMGGDKMGDLKMGHGSSHKSEKK
jgi:hypothetical protein